MFDLLHPGAQRFVVGAVEHTRHLSSWLSSELWKPEVDMFLCIYCQLNSLITKKSVVFSRSQLTLLFILAKKMGFPLVTS